MTIAERELFHGAALAQIIRANDEGACVRASERSQSLYLLAENVGLYIKYSKNRLSPWKFGFPSVQRNEVESALAGGLRAMLICLVCERDGFVGLTYDEFVLLMPNEVDRTGTIYVTRRRQRLYSVRGSGGGLKHKVSSSRFVDLSMQLISGGQ